MKTVGAMFLLTVCLALATQSGCSQPGNSPTLITGHKADASSQWSEDLFSFAVENLNHLEDNDCAEMLQSTVRRIEAVQLDSALAQVRKLKDSPAKAAHIAEWERERASLGPLPPNALLTSWPEPDMLRQVVSQLNQWVDTQPKTAESKPDPMLATLPAKLLKLPMLEDLGQPHFTAYDGYMLMEAVWLRDAARSKWAGGSTTDELQVARNLFDWTIRNIQSDYDESDRVPQVPWETLFLGHGTSWERAWTYILLLRQRGIAAAVLAIRKTEPAAANQPAKETLEPWCVGVLIGDKEKSLYLFDPKLGLPIPGPNGVVADTAGWLDVRPATLSQVTANPKLLDQLALGDKPYWVGKAELKRVVALVEASPLYLSGRAKRIETRLVGDQRLVLNAEPSQQADRLKAAAVNDVRLWNLPFTTHRARLSLGPEAVTMRLLAYEPFMTGLGAGAPLYKGRILHLKGRYFDEREAIAYYQKARPRNQTVIEDAPKFAKAQFDRLLQDARKHFGGDVTLQEEAYFKQRAELQARHRVDAIISGKLSASFWLGLIQYDLGEYPAAMDYFRVRTLQFGPKVFWASGAVYNIARTLEASGQRQKAIQEYRANLLLRNDDGCLLRARWLKELDEEKTLRADAKKPDIRKKGEKKSVEKNIGEKPETTKK